MIHRLRVRNFKCFEDLSLEMSNLNVFAGINSMGKSTMIQALLLLRQSYDMGTISKGIHLNGDIVSIGIGKDLLYRNSQKDEIEISIDGDNHSMLWKYDYEAESDYLSVNHTSAVGAFEDINLFSLTFSYVSAERIGPQRIYKKSRHEVYDKNQVGYKGELFADYLAERGFEDKIENKEVLYKGIGNFLIYQVDAWLSEISPGVSLSTTKLPEAGLVRVEYKAEGIVDSLNPLNVGFGLSYTAPIIVSLLKAKSGELVILENPEAHLHPKGQRKMGELIAKASAGGVQVVVETHSDHLLNGIRLAVKNGIIDRNIVRINYFFVDNREKEFVHKKTSPAILDDGSLSDWPDGFFDEWDKAIDELF